MKIFEIGTGYTSIPADKGAATEIVVESLSHALVAQGHDVTVVDIEDDRRLPSDLDILEVRMPRGFSGTDEALGVRHKLKRVAYSVALARTLRRTLAALPAGERAVLHFHNQYNLYFFLRMVPRRLRRRALVAYTVHSYVWHGAWEDIERTVRRRYFQEVACMRAADVTFVLNAHAAATATEHLGVAPARIVRIANGVDTDAYHPLPAGDAEVEALRRGLGLEGRLCAIQVGSVCPRKNQLGALKLLEPLMRADERLCFIYAGGVIDAAYQAQVEAYAKERGLAERVRYLGELAPGTELNRHYNLAFALVFPATAEAFGLAITEAMAAGVPALVPASLDVELPSVLRFDGAEDFAEKLGSLLESPEARARAGSQAREDVCGVWSWSHVAADYAHAFAERMADGEHLGKGC